MGHAQDWSPVDVGDLVKIRRTAAGEALAFAPGPVWIVLVLGKETEFREALLKEWQAVGTGKRLTLGILSAEGEGEAKTAAAKVVFEVVGLHQQ